MNALLVALLLQVDPPNGSTIAVEMKLGAVAVEIQGRVVPCTKNKRCAQLPNGKRVTGRFEADRFIVEGVP